MDYSLLGWINVLILGILITPYILNFLNRNFIKTRNKQYFKVIKILRKAHKPLGIALVVFGLIHGYMALGSLRLHTGTLFYISIFITVTLGGSFHKTKKRAFLLWHRRMALLTVALFLLHLLAPGAIYYLLR